MTHWTDAGFGTDPEGDAGRRAELGPARFDPADLPVLADAIRRTAHLVPPSAAEVVEVLGAEVVEQLDDGPYADVPPGYFVREDPDYGEVLVPIPAPAAPGPHEVRRVEYPWGVAWTCACGRWEAVATGPSSARWAGADHRRHADGEEAGRGQ